MFGACFPPAAPGAGPAGLLSVAMVWDTDPKSDTRHHAGPPSMTAPPGHRVWSSLRWVSAPDPPLCAHLPVFRCAVRTAPNRLICTRVCLAHSQSGRLRVLEDERTQIDGLFSASLAVGWSSRRGRSARTSGSGVRWPGSACGAGFV
jgi:hypothetical protein